MLETVGFVLTIAGAIVGIITKNRRIDRGVERAVEKRLNKMYGDQEETEGNEEEES